MLSPRIFSLTHRGALALRQPIVKTAGINQVRWLTEKSEKVKVLMVLYDGGKDAEEFPELLGKLLVSTFNAASADM